MACAGMCLTASSGAAGCAAGAQATPWDRRTQLDCPSGTVVVTDTVIVTGSDGTRTALERHRTECASPSP
jgi:hypothetical protein